MRIKNKVILVYKRITIINYFVEGTAFGNESILDETARSGNFPVSDLVLVRLVTLANPSS